MTRKEVFEYCRKQYKTEPDYPWHDWNAVLALLWKLTGVK